MSILKKASVFLGILLFISCSKSSEKRELKAYVSSFLNDNPSIVAFGKVDLMTILEKTDYKAVDKIGKIIATEKERFSHSLNIDVPIHFAVEGPFDKNGNPATFYAFFDVKNQDSLADRLGSSGLFVEESGDLKITENQDVTIGFNEHVAVLISKKEKYDPKTTMAAAFKRFENDESTGKVVSILESKGDLVTGMNVENLFGTSNTDLAKLDATKQKELEAMTTDSYIQTALHFNAGKIQLETTNLFSTALQNRMFFKTGSNETLLSKLGKGNARFGIATQLDMPKLESFMDDFAPDFKKKITQANFQVQMAMMAAGDKPLSGIFSGLIGAVLVGDLLKDGSITPEVNFHMGLGNQGELFSTIASAFFSKGTDGNYGFQGMDFKINQYEVTGNTKNAGAGVNSLIIPADASQFGKKGITAFINLEKLDVKSFGFRGGQKTIELVKSMSFEMTNEGSKMVISTHNSSENVLRQIVQLYLKDIEKQLEGLSLNV